MPLNDKGMFSDLDLNHRRSITKVRGGWTEDKIKRELKSGKCTTSKQMFYANIMKFDSPEEFAENLCYHGSGRSIGVLRPSVVLKNTEDFGGGYGDKFFGVSLSRDKNIASNFTGMSRSGCVAPVLLQRGTIIKEMPDLKDSEDVNDIIIDLWTEGVDAVTIGDHTKEHSEQEVVVLNPRCLAVGPTESYQVFQKPKMPSMNKEEIEELWLKSSDLYKEEAERNWINSNELFKAKYGKEKSPETRWNSKQKNLYNYHKHNVEVYLENKMKNNDVSLDNSINAFLNKNKKTETIEKKRNKKLKL